MDDEKIFNIRNELLNDAFWLSYILELKRKITDRDTKEVMVNFLMFFGSVFCGEVLTANLGGMSNNAITTKKEIIDFRNSNLKDCFTSTSNTAKKTIEQMGVDLDSYIFDIVLTLNSSNLLDINFRNWNYNRAENNRMMDCIVASSKAWMESLMPEIYEAILKIFEEQTNKLTKKLCDFNIIKKSYSSYKLYIHAKLSADDKIYILQRYGIFKIVQFFDNLFDESIEIKINNFCFDYKRFIMKCKAILIEMVYNDSKNNKNITILGEVFKRNKSMIPPGFYSLNRKVRDNIHYNDYHYLTEDNVELIKNYQDVYFENLISVFDSEIAYKFNFSYQLGLAIAKLRYVES